MRGELAKLWLVADKRDAAPFGLCLLFTPSASSPLEFRPT
jgi:hypothetical protein